MDAIQALADLTEISSQIRAVVLVDGDGSVLGSTLGDERRAARVADCARRLLEEAGSVATGRVEAPVAQLEASMPDGSVFVVREGERTIVATAAADPTVGLVFYDLKSCLRGLGEPEPKQEAEPKPRPRPKPRPKPKPGPEPKADREAGPKPKPRPRRTPKPPEEDADGAS